MGPNPARSTRPQAATTAAAAREDSTPDLYTGVLPRPPDPSPTANTGPSAA